MKPGSRNSKVVEVSSEPNCSYVIEDQIHMYISIYTYLHIHTYIYISHSGILHFYEILGAVGLASGGLVVVLINDAMLAAASHLCEFSQNRALRHCDRAIIASVSIQAPTPCGANLKQSCSRHFSASVNTDANRRLTTARTGHSTVSV